MWPFGDEEIVENTITAHDVVSYSVDGAFVVILVAVILMWKWRTNVRRLKSLEQESRRRKVDV